MSNLAKFLINKEIKKKTKFLDLGNCGLTDLAAEVPELFELEWLETLILSNGYENLRTQERQESANAEAPNRFSQLPPQLKALVNLKALYISSFEITQYTENYWHLEPMGLALSGFEVIAHFKQLEILDCRYRMLGSVECLNGLPKLQYLNLENNMISNLHYLDGLPELKYLVLKGNSIESITGIYDLPKLEFLDLSFNRLIDVKGLATFDRLKSLNLAENNIEDLKGIQNLTALVSLNLSTNRFRNIYRLLNLPSLEVLILNNNPDLNNEHTDLERLQNLTGLRQLCLSNLGIDKLGWLVNLSNLEKLELKNNRIVDIQPLPKLINLKHLYLGGNQIVDIEGLGNFDSIVELDIEHNTITNILPLIPLLHKGFDVVTKEPYDPAIELQSKIYLYANPIENPPYEVVDQGTQAVLDFLAEGQTSQTVEISSDHIYEVKILIIGEGGAGKTSLFRKIRDANSALPGENDSTMGIEIHQLKLKTRHDKDICANIWDFGGQEIYHATHQFFFSKNALYILVDDTRTNNDTTVNDRSFAYWFGLVDLLGSNSPLLIVQNEKNDRSKQLEIGSMRGRFGFIKEVVRTNLYSSRGLLDVHTAIENQVQGLLSRNVSLPISWMEVRNDIKALEAECPEIGVDQWENICKKHGIETPEKQKSLSQYFHDVGLFLHFQDDPLLRKSVILNKVWATDAIYRILNDETIKDHSGEFEESDLDRIWKKDNLSKYRDEFLALMLKFNLCFELPDRPQKRWLSPQLLPKEQPVYDWSGSRHKELHYKYDFLPSGLISRLIVRLNRFIVRTDLAWRSGVVMERLGAQAEVMEVLDDTIRIRVQGEDQNYRKELMALITDEFEQIHTLFTGLKFNVLVACNCSTCIESDDPHLYNYKNLLQRKKDGKTTQECEKSYEMISVIELLDESKPATLNKKKLTKSEHLKTLIADNRMDEAFLELKEELPGEDLVVIVQSDWSTLRNSEIAGTLSPSETRVTRSEITQRLLLLVGKIKN